MSIATLILGESGAGKSTSMRNLDPSKTLLIQAIKKPLPFKSEGWAYRTETAGNILVTDNSERIINLMRKTKRKIIILDDYQYILANEFMRRSAERGYDKFTEIAKHAWDIFNVSSELADDVRVYILSHTQTDELGTRMKTIGKLLDDKITCEGMFTIVLKAIRHDGENLFSTVNNGSDTTKSPMGMFDTETIPNDLLIVDQAITNYYGVTQ